MSFCKYSSEYIKGKTTAIDNSFLTEFMPNAPEHTTKVYLYGLYICNSNKDITLDNFASDLHISTEDVESSFLFWEEIGLVQILNSSLDSPMEIRYLPTSEGSFAYRKYNKDTYKKFNTVVEETISGRSVGPNELNEYYYLIESKKLEKEALLSIIKYCVELKDNKVNYPYILAVAKNFIRDNLLTLDEVNTRIKDNGKNTAEVTDVLRALRLKSAPTDYDLNSYTIWTKQLNFSYGAIMILCKRVKKGGMARLDSLVTKCYQLRIYDEKEIEAYFNNQDEYYDIARTVTRNLGVRYDDLSNVVDTYITNWIDLGFSKDTLKEISNFCFLKNIKTLNGLDEVVEKFYALGLLTVESIHDHIDRLNAIDSKIKVILEKVMLQRNVIELDRKYYNTWTNEWNMTDELIDYACTLAYDKTQPMAYLNKILSTYHSNKVNTVEQAKSIVVEYATPKANQPKQTKKTIKNRTYEKQDLDAMFTDIKKVDL